MDENQEAGFPELEAFEAEQARRHGLLIRSLATLGTVLSAVGCALIVLLTGRFVYSGWFLLAIGLIMLFRAGLSRFTGIDTRSRDDWVGVVHADDWKAPESDESRVTADE